MENASLVQQVVRDAKIKTFALEQEMECTLGKTISISLLVS